MSRAYQITLQERQQRVIRAADHVSTELELLPLLPAEQMADLLAAELLRRGFERKGDVLQRKEEGVTLTVNPRTATVTVGIEGSQEVELESERIGWADDEEGPGAKHVRKHLKKELERDFDRKAELHAKNLAAQLTQKLEGRLADVRKELDQAVNRVTADALKQKAAQLGTIKELTEDAQSGSMTIVLEV